MTNIRSGLGPGFIYGETWQKTNRGMVKFSFSLYSVLDFLLVVAVAALIVDPFFKWTIL